MRAARVALLASAAAALAQPATAAAAPCTVYPTSEFRAAECLRQISDDTMVTVNERYDYAEYLASYYMAWAQRQPGFVVELASCVWEDCNPDYYTNMVCQAVWGEDCGAPGVRP